MNAQRQSNNTALFPDLDNKYCSRSLKRFLHVMLLFLQVDRELSKEQKIEGKKKDN